MLFRNNLFGSYIIKKYFYTDKYDKLIQRFNGNKGKYFYFVERKYFFENFSFKNKVILDLGTGTANLVKYIKPNFKYFIGIDREKSLLSEAKNKFIKDKANIYLLCSDAENIPIKNNSVDVILALGLFERTSSLNKIFIECNKILKKDGVFKFTIWNSKRSVILKLFDRKLSGSYEFSLDQIKLELKKSGFKIYFIQSVFYLPRKIFWIIYKILYFEFLRSFYLYLCAKIENYLSLYFNERLKGSELIIFAKKNNLL